MKSFNGNALFFIENFLVFAIWPIWWWTNFDFDQQKQLKKQMEISYKSRSFDW